MEDSWHFVKLVSCHGEELECEIAELRDSESSCLYLTVAGLKSELADKRRRLKDFEGLSFSLEETGGLGICHG